MNVHTDFQVIGEKAVAEILMSSELEVMSLVEKAYLTHDARESNNPPSYFLRFPDRPDDRIIALPAALGRGDAEINGLKWISSFPGNLGKGLPRASAVLILNDPGTGFPIACLEGSAISAARTAASAALAAHRLTTENGRPRSVSFIGASPIARGIHRFLAATGWEFDDIGVYDLSRERAEAFTTQDFSPDSRRTVHSGMEQAIRSAGLVVFATTAGTPHVTDAAWFDHGPLVLHISLRDLAPEIVLNSVNIVDDIDHCLREDTSLHLAEQMVRGRDFVNGTLGDVLLGRLCPPANRVTIFSPFGLGVLDLAVARHVHLRAIETGRAVEIPGFRLR